MGQLEFGIYDDFDNVPVPELEQHYGVQGKPVYRSHGQTGAGHPADEDDISEVADGSAEHENDWVDMDEAEMAADEANR